MNIYNIDWGVLVEQYLPISLRKPICLIWVQSCLKHIEGLHSDFLAFRTKCLYRINHNSQICYMEAVLNDYFDNDLRRIRIVNVSFKEPIYFYEPEENKEVFFYEPEDNKPVYFREEDEFIGDGVDFVVMVPPELQPETETAELALLTQMRGQIEYYKLYSKNYQIKWEQANV